jgi:hypothetical protein
MGPFEGAFLGHTLLHENAFKNKPSPPGGGDGLLGNENPAVCQRLKRARPAVDSRRIFSGSRVGPGAWTPLR